MDFTSRQIRAFLLAADYGSFTRALPRIALKEGIRLRKLLPSDESLESVFSYLLEA